MERLRKRFNIAGTCFPNKHYMVDLTERLNEIKVRKSGQAIKVDVDSLSAFSMGLND